MKEYIVTSAAVVLLAAFLILVPACRRGPGPPSLGSFRAYSLREAQLRSSHPGEKDTELANLGGITSLAGMVYDARSDDRILVGRSNTGQPPVTLDDLVVALRSVLVREEFPLVSIDRTAETKRTGRQTILLKGDIANTQFGKDLLEADIVLKKLALELLPSPVGEVRSYFSSFLDQVRQGTTADLIGSRFWFYIMGDPSFAAVEGVFVIREMRIGVKTEVMYAIVKGKPVADLRRVQDNPGDAFSAQLTKHYFDFCRTYPAVGRVKTLLDLVSMAKGIETFPKSLDLDHWLRDYRTAYVQTPLEYSLLRRQEKVAGSQGLEVELNGGVELRARVLRLRAGDTSVLKDAVLNSRPRTDSLTWTVLLEGWEIPGALPVPYESPKLDSKTTESAAAEPTDQGCSVEAQVRRLGELPLIYDGPFTPPNVQIPLFRRYEQLLPQGQIAVPPIGAQGADTRGGVSADIQIKPEDFSPGKEQKK